MESNILMNYDKVIAELVVRLQRAEEAISRPERTSDALTGFTTVVTESILTLDERIKKSENVR